MLRTHAWSAALLIGGAAPLAALATASTSVVVATVFVVAIAIEVGLLTATRNLRSPVVLIPCLTFGVVGLAGYLLYPSLADTARVSVALPADPEMYTSAAKTFLVAGAAFTFGALWVLAGSRQTQARAEVVTLRAVPVRSGVLIAVGYLALVVLIYGKGETLLRASTYLEASGPIAALSVGTSLTIPAVLALAVAASRSRGGVRLAAYAGVFAWLVVLFAIATRTLAIVPGLLLVASYLAPGGKLKPVNVLLTALGTLVLLQLSLTMRSGLTGFGLLPFVQRLLDDPGLLWRVDIGAMFGNILVAVPLAGDIAVYQRPLSLHEFWVSVSPLPGFATDWGDIAPTMRLNAFTPFSGLGELSNQGLLTLTFYMVAAGVVFARLDLAVHKLQGVSAAMGTLLLVGLSLLFSLDMLQYNLRSGTRIVYYAIVLVVMLRLVAARRPSQLDRPQLGRARVGSS